MSNSTPKALLLISLLTLLIVPFLSVAGSGNSDDLLGKTSAKAILQGYSEFNEEYQRFEPTASEIQHMSTLKGKSLLVMFGSWCHDSEREVPRLLKLLDKSDAQLAEVTFLAVNQSKEEESGLAELHGLKYTPTIVLFDGDKEIGRIIERPNVSLAQDLAEFVKN